MSEGAGPSDTKLNLLLIGTLAVAVVVVISVSRTLLGLVFTPSAEASVQAVEEPATPPAHAPRAVRTVSKQTWQPRYAVPRPPKREPPATNESPTFKFDPLPPSVAAEMRKRQMDYLRADLLENADDNPEDMPTLADIEEMERKGVMVW